MGLKPNLLVISDLHLGERLGRGRLPDPRTEQALVDFLRYHTNQRRQERPWRLVINGDAVDLVGMCVMPHEVGEIAGFESEDHLYGLGDQARPISDGQTQGVDAVRGLRGKRAEGVVVHLALALGQGAYESGYGTSRFTLAGNALFGQWTYGGTRSTRFSSSSRCTVGSSAAGASSAKIR